MKSKYCGMRIIDSGVTEQNYPYVVTGYMNKKRLAAKIMFVKIGSHSYYHLWQITTAEDEIMWAWENKKVNFSNVKKISPYFGYLNKEPYVCVLNRATELPKILSIIPLFYVDCYTTHCSEQQLKEIAIDFARQNKMSFSPSQSVLHIEEIMCSSVNNKKDVDPRKQARKYKKMHFFARSEGKRKHATRTRNKGRSLAVCR